MCVSVCSCVCVCEGFAGDTVVDLFKIKDTLYQHGHHSILHAITSSLLLGVPSCIF